MVATFPLSVVLSAVDRLSGPLGKAGGALGKFGRNATQAGKALSFGLTLPIIALGTATVATAVQYESAMLNVKALTQANAEQFDKLSASARNLGKTTQFSATQAAQAQGFLAQAGFEVNEVLGATPEILNLAAAANLEMGRSAEIAAIILRGYGRDVGDLRDVTNILTATFLGSSQTLEELFEAMKLAGPLASGFGFKMEETAAILGQFANNGFQASLGGTAFRGAMQRLLKPAGDAVSIFRKLGLSKVDFFDSAGRVLSLRNAVVKLNEAGATAEDVFAIFGLRAGPAMVKLVGEGVGAIDRLQRKIENAGDIAERVGKEKMSGLAGTLLLLKSQFQELQIVIGESGLIPWVTKVAVKITAFIGRVAELDPKLLKMGLVVAGVAAALGPFLIALGLVATGVGALKGAVLFILPLFKKMALVLLRLVIPAIWSFTAALVANPIGAVVVGVIALIAVGVTLAKKWRVIGNFIGGIFSGIGKVIGKVVDLALDALGALIGIFPDWLIKLVSGGGATTASLTVQRDQVAARVSPGRIASANSGSAGAGASGEARVFVDFENVPAGVRIEADPLGTAALELTQGFAMEGGL